MERDKGGIFGFGILGDKQEKEHYPGCNEKEYQHIWRNAEKQLRKHGYTITLKQFEDIFVSFDDLFEYDYTFNDKVMAVVHEAVEAEEVKRKTGKWIAPRDYYDELSKKGIVEIEPHHKAEKIAPIEHRIFELAWERRRRKTMSERIGSDESMSKECDGIFGFGIIGSLGILREKKEERRPIQMAELPDCDICKQKGTKREAHYDCKTTMGPWAYLCEFHKDLVGSTPCNRLEKRVKIAAAKTGKIPIVNIPISCDDVCEVSCPHCGEPRTVEPDANYVVECESCGNKYRVASFL